MKKPEKIALRIHVDKEKSEFVNHLGKPLFNYTIKLPSWVGLAYNPHHVKVEINEKSSSWIEFRDSTNSEEIETYVKKNWSKKLSKMRKLNNNYMQVFTLGRGNSGFVSHEAYKNYHRELAELNEKYGVGASINNGGIRTDE